MTFLDVSDGVGQWMAGSGRDNDVVISSRVRLARNVAGHRFVNRASAEERIELCAQLRASIEKADLASDMFYVDLEEAPDLERLLLVERHLISREHADAEGPRGVLVAQNESFSVMINEEDHLRMQTMSGGLELEAAWQAMSAVDEAIEKEVHYAFDRRYGYVTACPTNVGTGMRVSVMVHLPALTMTRELQRVFNAAAKIDFIVRGLYGEGTQSHGDFFQISNQKTLGRSEDEILRNLAAVVPQVIKYERKVRDMMLTEHRRQVEDRVWRAWGILANARMISSEEALHLLSQMRLGVTLGLLKDVDAGAVNRLFILTRPAHLQKIEGRSLDSQERDQVRADFIRRQLAETGLPPRATAS